MRVLFSLIRLFSDVKWHRKKTNIGQKIAKEEIEEIFVRQNSKNSHTKSAIAISQA